MLMVDVEGVSGFSSDAEGHFLPLVFLSCPMSIAVS